MTDKIPYHCPTIENVSYNVRRAMTGEQWNPWYLSCNSNKMLTLDHLNQTPSQRTNHIHIYKIICLGICQSKLWWNDNKNCSLQGVIMIASQWHWITTSQLIDVNHSGINVVKLKCLNVSPLWLNWGKEHLNDNSTNIQFKTSCHEGELKVPETSFWECLRVIILC